MNKKILVLEDEDNIRGFVVINLRRAGFDTVEFALGQQAADYLCNSSDVSVAVLDVMLPDISGFEVCRRAREAGCTAGIIMLTAMSQEADKIAGFSTGADDYVIKPFSVVELVARVEALNRRVAGGGFGGDLLIDGEFRLDLRSRELRCAEKKIELTQVEYLIMKTFLENRGKALSRDDILDMVWGKDYQGDLKVVDVNIRRLRLKIEEDAAAPRHIMTIWGFGYKWES